MKKILSFILIFVMLTVLCTDASGALAPHAIITSYNNHYVYGEKFTVNLSVRISDIFNLEYMKIYMDCNKDVIKCIDNGTITPSHAKCVFEVEETQTGYLFTFSLNRDVNTDVLYSYCEYDFEVVGTGEPQVSFKGETKMLDKAPVESVLRTDMPVDHVFDREELPKIELLNKYSAFVRDGFLYLNEPVHRNVLLRNVSSSDSIYPVELTKHYENEQVATGDSLYIYFHDKVSDEIPICLMGDVNCDGKVSAADARLVLRHSANLSILEGYAVMAAANVNYDPWVNAADARLILRVAAQMEKMKVPAIEMKVGDVIEIGPLKNVGSGCYNWSCTVMDRNGVSISDGISVSGDVTPPENVVLNPGTPFDWRFTITAEKSGAYNLDFTLSDYMSINPEITSLITSIDMFTVDIIVTD